MAELVPLVDPPLPPMYNAGATEAALSVLGLAEARKLMRDRNLAGWDSFVHFAHSHRHVTRLWVLPEGRTQMPLTMTDDSA